MLALPLFFRSSNWQTVAAVILIGVFLIAGNKIGLADDAQPIQQSNANSVRQANHYEPVEAGRTAPATQPLALPGATNRDATKSNGFGPEAILSLLFSLGVVVGLFYGAAWFIRRSLPPAARRLPTEVVEVLGRAPLAGRQQMQLVRLGAKLLLVAISADGANCLSEVTTANEVDRLMSLCQESRRAPRNGKAKTAEAENV
jgi:flagellar biogenesis protein FliO